MGIVIGGLAAMFAVTALAARLSRDSKQRSCCVVVDPARDVRMAGAYNSDVVTDGDLTRSSTPQR